MKKLIMVLLMWCIGCTTYAQTHIPTSKPIKIDNATEGKKVKQKYRMKAKFQCPDEPMMLSSYPEGPNFELVNDSLIFTYKLSFISTAYKCVSSGGVILQVIDSDLNIVATEFVAVDQFDTLVRFFMFFGDKNFDSSKYFVQLKIETSSNSYLGTMATLPDRFKQ